MSNLVFPDLPGMDVELTYAPAYETEIMKTASGREQRVSMDSTPTRTYTLRSNVLRESVAAPAPFAAYSEVGVIQYFFDTHRGQWDSFLFNAPDPGGVVQRRVRFDAGTLKLRRIVPGVWSCELDLLAVIT